MKKLILALIVLSIIYSCNQPSNPADAPKTSTTSIDQNTEKKNISNLLDSLNSKAAKAEFEPYFALYTEDAVFAGTDATERWVKPAFKTWAKPFFDAGAAWNFKMLERNIYFDKTGNLAWFDELLNTQMKICRGSGVVVKENGTWKIKQYILSMTVPNDQLDPVLKLKTPVEDALIRKLSGE